MTPKEYYSQAIKLDERIGYLMEEEAECRAKALSVKSAGAGLRVQSSMPNEAGYTSHVMDAVVYHREIEAELRLLNALKLQMERVIKTLPNEDERMTIRYRYLRNCSFPRVADKLCASLSAVKIWHARALDHTVLPKDAINLSTDLSKKQEIPEML